MKTTNNVGTMRLFAFCDSIGIPRPQPEFKFLEEYGRKWAFDFAWVGGLAWVQGGIALEIEGGTSKLGKSRHANPKGFAADKEKYGWATVLGWRVLSVTTAQFVSGLHHVWLEILFGKRDPSEVPQFLENNK